MHGTLSCSQQYTVLAMHYRLHEQESMVLHQGIRQRKAALLNMCPSKLAIAC